MKLKSRTRQPFIHSDAEQESESMQISALIVDHFTHDIIYTKVFSGLKPRTYQPLIHSDAEQESESTQINDSLVVHIIYEIEVTRTTIVYP